MRILSLLGILLGLLPGPAIAQQLLWERAFLHPTSIGSEAAENVVVTATQQLLLTGGYAPPRTGCGPLYRAYYRVYTLGGTLVREQLGRGLGNGDSNFAPVANGGWWTAPGFACVGTTRYQRAYVQRVTAQADTGRAWFLAAAPPQTSARAILVLPNRLLVAGYVSPTGMPNGQAQQYQLTCSDTLGTVRWQRSYARQPLALDYPTAVLPTPRGGYLISGDGFVSPGYRHYLVETDSLGIFRRSRLLLPLGPGFPDGLRWTNGSNALALPHAGGYLLTGTADSTGGGLITHIGYVMRLDTSLNVVWTYRHPPALAGTLATSNYAYRIQLLPNGTVGVLLTDVRQAGTPAVYLTQLDVATGRRVAFYTLGSNTQTAVIPYDWQWVGDGTLVLAGKSTATGATYVQSYLARYDFRGTPLAAARPGAGLAAGGVSLWAYPVPATDRATVQVSGLGAHPGRLELLDGLGQVVHAQAVAADGDQSVHLSGRAAGLYVARLVDGAGRVRGSCKLVVMP